ncbi:MAG: MmcQ/YjbR family DNA-binding protein [Bacteroidetes bacterium]|nr:MmcQ/YjbR family DNA-binding protein [Bacteroidota bacterium]
MNIEEFREYCLRKIGTTEGTPFGPDLLLLKVGDKMFALCSINNFISINLKCEPEKAILLREKYPQITPGYHMSKVHWNTVEIENLNNSFIKELIDHSYELVLNSLSKKTKTALGFSN